MLGITTTSFAAEHSHCSASEKAIFNCRIKDSSKIVSLCGSSDLSSKKGYLQYRFGRPGNVELQFPKNKQGSQDRFRWAHYFRFQVDRTEVSFNNGGYKYTLFHYYEGDLEPPTTTGGIRVGETELSCIDPIINELPKLELEKIVPCDRESALNLKECE